MLTGVVGGMAEYFDIDPVLVRLAWVVFCFVTAGMGLLLYIVMAIIMPRQETVDAEPLDDEQEDVTASGDRAAEPHPRMRGPRGRSAMGDGAGRRRNVVAMILIVVGALALVANLDLFSWFTWDVFWPLLLIGIGAALLIGRARRR